MLTVYLIGQEWKRGLIFYMYTHIHKKSDPFLLQKWAASVSETFAIYCCFDKGLTIGLMDFSLLFLRNEKLVKYWRIWTRIEILSSFFSLCMSLQNGQKISSRWIRMYVRKDRIDISLFNLLPFRSQEKLSVIT